MSDIVERLRESSRVSHGYSIDRGSLDAGMAGILADEAADEIDRLTALVEHLKADRIRISEEAEAEIARLTAERDAAKAAGRLEGLEEAAKVAEREGGWRDHHMAHKISADIRALKEKQPCPRSYRK